MDESFFRTLKTEGLYHVNGVDPDHAERERFASIEMVDKRQRLHVYLDDTSPVPFEQRIPQHAA